MRAALYIRVSTDEQAREGFSIPAQKEKLTAYTISQDWEIYDYYIDDGWSAKNTKRPAFQSMMRAAEQRLFDVILVYKLDRFTRNVRDLYEVLDQLTKLNISFRSSQEQFDTTTTMGRAMVGMLGIFAQWERETIADRVYMGMETKILSGKRNGSSAPMGYDLVNGRLEINEEAPFVRELFDLYLQNKGTPAVCKILAERGRPMHTHTLTYILRNPIYCGRFRWNYRSNGNRTFKEIIVDGDTDPIVTIEEFEQVQRMITRGRKLGRAATSDYIFSGILVCNRCGKPMTAGIRKYKSGYAVSFYRCAGKTEYATCDMPRVREESVEDALFDMLKYNKAELAKYIQVEDKPKVQKDLKLLQKDLEQIKKRREKWRQAFASELISMEELRKYTDEEKGREQELQMQIEEMQLSTSSYVSVDEVHHMFKDIHKAWRQIKDKQAKKLFIQEIFSQITVDTEAMAPRGGRGSRYECDITGWKLNQ